MTDDLCKLLDYGIKDEAAASKLYSKIRRASRCCRAIRRIMSEIGKEERHHTKILREVRKEVC